jgi:tetratricopeptide (TPR) repeat protein
LETKINTYGYNLINQKKIEDANKVLRMNVQLFPESANVYDSYGESFMLLGQKEDAIKYFEMAIAKDKDGVTADNSKKMIEKIKNGGH